MRNTRGIRADPNQPAPMKTSKQKIEAMRRAVEDGAYRSPLYTWMVTHHDDLVEKGVGGRMPWKKLCADFAADGIMDAQGKIPTCQRAGRTWQKVCQVMKARAARKASESRPQRSRSDPNWQPPISRTVPVPSQPAPYYRGRSEQLSGPDLRERQHPQDQVTPGSKLPVSNRVYPPEDRSWLNELPPEARAKYEKIFAQLKASDIKKFGSM